MATEQALSRIKILYLATNPLDTERLDLETEIARVEQRIRAGAYRDTIRLIPALAVTTDDLQRLILEHRPNLIHFSGHGKEDGQIVLRGPDGDARPIAPEAVVHLIRLYRTLLRQRFDTELVGVILNACDSSPLAEMLGSEVSGAVGMNGEISDNSAIIFAATFYQGISFGCTLRQSFDQAVAQLLLEDTGEERIPAYFGEGAEVAPGATTGAAAPAATTVKYGSKVFGWAREPDEPIDFLIVTALPEERDAMFRHLTEAVLLPPREGTVRVYYAAEIPAEIDGDVGKYRLIVAPLLDMGNKEALGATQDAIRLWTPRYVVLVGIAGGFAKNGVKLGDLLVPNQIADYSHAKVKGRREEIRWQAQPTDPELRGRAGALLPDQWQKDIREGRPEETAPVVHPGTVATGDRVIAARRVLATFVEHWPKLIGVEMEAGGVAKACFDAPDPRPRFFMVRGVSDLADEKKDSAGVGLWRTYASDVAAAYAVGLIRSGPVPFRRAV
jgi:nucleoside phosphorylase